MSVKPAGSVPAQKVEKAVGTEIEWLVDRHDGAPNFEMRRFRISVGGSIPAHHHPDIEHEQYVLKGSYKIGLGETVVDVKEGDSVFIPKGVKHWYRNTGDVEAEFLCIVPKTDDYQSIYEAEGEQR